MTLNDRTYERICELVRGYFGIHLAQEKQFLVVNRLHNHVRSLGLDSYEAFLDHVSADVSGQALDVLADLISTNHTFFFREEAHFEFLKTQVLPEIETHLAHVRDDDLRVWCAAASTGEEAYSIVMTMLDYFGARYARFDAGLLASDLSLKALRHAAAGVYTSEQVQRVPPELRQRYLRPRGASWVVAPEVRAEVLFRKFNLMTARYPFKKPFHVIFCRNVMIYFDSGTRRRLVSALFQATAPGGYLFIGHAESIAPDSRGYQQVRPAVYRRPEAGDVQRR
jgi:chemotaxis protein methyltransferase CheR